ncbi:MAG: MBOAT family protein [Clostridia bacterium]|nr:MBOAT family protein [Clostridia bacterium]
MNFADILFLFVFFPLCVGFYLFKKQVKYRNAILLVFSLIFYAWGEPLKLVLLLLSAMINFLLARSIDSNRGNKLCKMSLILSLIYNIGMLGIFKYTDFVTENLNNLFGLSIPAANIVLPLGISFYTFQIMSYIIDVYWENVPVQKDFSKLLLYISLFPQLVAGPIVRYSTIAEEIDVRKTTLTDLTEGFTRMIVGLAKKVILANTLSIIATNYLTTVAETSSVVATWVGIIAYSMQVYFDFSGYSDMAIGMGRIFGFHFNENFNYPFMCRTIQEFWQRWHISLGSFFRDYLLYLPIFGKRRQVLSLFLVWFTTGLWHGASWNFIAWGLYFGIFIFVEQKIGKKTLKKIPDVVMHIYNKLVIIIGFGIFYYDNCPSIGSFFSQMGSFLGNLFGFSGNGFFRAEEFTSGPYSQTLRENVYFMRYAWIFVISLIVCFPVLRFVKDKIKNCNMPVQAGAQLISTFCCIGLLIICMIMLVSSKNNPFLYFRF